MLYAIHAFYVNKEIILIFNFTSPFLRYINLCTVQVFFNKNIKLLMYLLRKHKGTLLPRSHQIDFQQLEIQRNVLIEFKVPFNPLLLVLTSGSQVRCSGQSYSLCAQGNIRSNHHRCMDWMKKTESDWAHSLDLALILRISFIIRSAAGHFFLGRQLVKLCSHLCAAKSASQISIINIRISNNDIFNVLFSPFLFEISNSNVICRSIQCVGLKIQT